jgi:hypothetical protein
MLHLIPSNLNQRLANAIYYSVAADRFYIKGKAAFWRLFGLGFIGLGLGASVGIGFYGYSYVSRNLDREGLLSSTFVKALSEVRLRATAEGIVQLDPREVKLAPGQTISLNSNSQLFLDPAAKVRADGEIKIEGPSISAPQVTSSRAVSSVPTIVNFTVFKSVPFGKGTVQTGWIFLTSAQRAPTQQYCYYTEASDTPGRNVMLDIGTDEKLETPKTLPNSFDLAAAFSRCVWFKGEES